MSPSKILVTSAFSFLVGVVFGSLWNFSLLLVFVLFVLAVSFLLGFSQNKKELLILVFLIISFFIFGSLRASFAEERKVGEDVLFFTSARDSLLERAASSIGGEELAMFSATVLGHKEDLSVETKEIFNKTGTRHILAISGLHLAIVASVILSILISLGISRKRAFWLALVGILAFILLVGAPASAVRAGIMAGLYLTAAHIGRVSEAWRLLLVAGFIMVFLSPHLLLGGVGFQLSFLAVLGIIFFKPFFDSILAFVKWDTLRSLLSLSFAAQLTTWPIVAHTFGTVSVVGPVANIVAVPMLPIIMMLGLAFVVFGAWSLVLAKIILWPAWVLLHAILSFVNWLGQFSFAAIELGGLSLLFMFFYYAILFFAYRIIRIHKTKEPSSL